MEETMANTNPSLLRVWWMNKNLRFDIAMSSIILILNNQAFLYIRTHKIPFDTECVLVFVIFYIVVGLSSCILWVLAITDVTLCDGAYGAGLISHIFGFGVFLLMLYYISLPLALYIGINLGLPCLLWFIGPSLWFGMQEVRGWWKFVTQPGRVM